MLLHTMHNNGLIMSNKLLTKYNGHHKIDKYYFSSKSDEPDIKCVPAQVNASELKAWLRPAKISSEDLPRWNANPALKILMIQTHNDFSKRPHDGEQKDPSHRTIPGQTEVQPLDNCMAQADMLKEIMTHAKLPLAALGAYIGASITFQTLPSYHYSDNEGTFGGNITSYYCSGTSWSVAWSYFHATRHTSAIMFYREGDGDDRRLEFERQLKRLQHHIAHPLLLAYAKSHISLLWTFDLLQQMNGQTFEIEQSVNLESWDWVLDRELKAPRRVNTNSLNPEQEVATAQEQALGRYNVLSSKLTNIRFRLRAFREQIIWLKRSNQEYAATLKGKTCVARRREVAELNTMLYQMSDFISVYLHDADTLDDRLKQQMFVISQLVNQRDSRIGLAIADLNFELAWQGKHVNMAMMAIAVVSFICLPTATVAGIFQTPMFNWAPPQEGVIVKEPFWIFWTVCGSTTLVLTVGWLLYLKQRHRNDRSRRSKARDIFKRKLLTSPTWSRKRKNSNAASPPGPNQTLSLAKTESMIDEELGLGVAHAMSMEKTE